MIETSRRSLIKSLVPLVAAPAIVRASSLMPIKALPPSDTVEILLHMRMQDAYRVMNASMARIFYGSNYEIVSYHVEAFPTFESVPLDKMFRV